MVSPAVIWMCTTNYVVVGQNHVVEWLWSRNLHIKKRFCHMLIVPLVCACLLIQIVGAWWLVIISFALVCRSTDCSTRSWLRDVPFSTQFFKKWNVWDGNKFEIEVSHKESSLQWNWCNNSLLTLHYARKCFHQIFSKKVLW